MTPIEIGILVLALVALVVTIRLLTASKALAINVIIGVVILAVANVLGAGVNITFWAILVCALAGLPGAILVILLALLDIAFVAAIV